MRYEWNDDPAAAGLSDSGYVVVMVPASLHTDVHTGLRMLHLSGEIIEKYELKGEVVYLNFHQMMARFDKSLGNGHLVICGQILQKIIDEFSHVHV